MDRLLEATYRAEQRHFWFKGFRRFVRPFLADATKGIPSARILDCGCGTGANLVMLADFGRTYGVDLNWTGVTYARQNGHVRTGLASVTHLPFVDDQFDVVTSFDVLYCLEDPAEAAAVAEMFRVLRPGGWAVLHVAALEILRGAHSLLSREVRRYTRKRLRETLERGGFQITRLTYTHATLLPLMLAVRLGHRITGVANEESDKELQIPVAPINDTLSGLLAIEAHAMKWMNMPFGSSVLGLARKPASDRS